MKLLILTVISSFVAGCVTIRGEQPRNLILGPQELKLAGSALHTVLAQNANAYVRK